MDLRQRAEKHLGGDHTPQGCDVAQGSTVINRAGTSRLYHSPCKIGYGIVRWGSCALCPVHWPTVGYPDGFALNHVSSCGAEGCKWREFSLDVLYQSLLGRGTRKLHQIKVAMHVISRVSVEGDFARVQIKAAAN
jgi:hypothetical protein